MTSAAAFQANLRKFAALLQIDDPNTLAAALEFRGDDKRWLKRLWEKGLSRPDPRRGKQLRRLATFLKLPRVRDFWTPEAEVNPFDLMTNRLVWADLVRRVVDFHQLLQQAKLRRSEAVREMLSHYGFNEELLLGDMLASFFRHPRPDQAGIDASVFYEIADDLRADSAFAVWVMSEHKKRLRDFVVDRLSDHPNWRLFLDRIGEHCMKVYPMLDDKNLPEFIDSELDRILERIRMRPLSPQEVLEQLKLFYLEESPQKKAIEEGWPIILGELRHRAEWDTWIGVECHGDVKSAEAKVRGMWKQAIEQTGHEFITPENFVSFMFAWMISSKRLPPSNSRS
jgi:hypothetical protein